MNLIFGGALRDRFIEKAKNLTYTEQIYASKNVFLSKDKKFIVMLIEPLK